MNDAAEASEGVQAGRFGTRAGWADAAGYTISDLRMLRRELVAGFLIAGFLAELVPTTAWNNLFITGHGVGSTVENVVLGPFLAIIRLRVQCRQRPACRGPVARRHQLMSMLSTMWTCHWAGRRIQRYLDVDPAAPLTAHEMHRLQPHLATCEKCASAAEDFRGLRRALATWSQRRTPDPHMVARVRETARQLIAEDAG